MSSAAPEIGKYILHENKSMAYYESVIALLEKEDQIALFGAGQGGRRTLSFLDHYNLGKQVRCFIDNNPRKWNTKFCEIPVLNIEQAKKLYPESMVVISCGEGDVIKEQCVLSGISTEKIIVPDLTLVDYKNNDFEFIWEYINEFNSLFALLKDEKSRQVLINILNYKISHDSALLKACCDPFEEQYFDKRLIGFDGVETILDCGAYIGDTVDAFLNICNFDRGEIHCFETDEENFKVLQRHVLEKEAKCVRLHNIAIWDKKENITFNAVGSGSGFVDPTGCIRVEADSIDNLFENKKVDFIKMDIEGAEVNALIGAFRTIKNFSPIMAISVYHTPGHLYQIPLLLKSINPNYELYLRHYRELSVSETVCYAIDPNRQNNL